MNHNELCVIQHGTHNKEIPIRPLRLSYIPVRIDLLARQQDVLILPIYLNRDKIAIDGWPEFDEDMRKMRYTRKYKAFIVHDSNSSILT